MRKLALTALTLLALTPMATQAGILQLSIDSSVALTDDPENLFGYDALRGQQAQLKIRIDLDNMPTRQTVQISGDDYIKYESTAPLHSWLSMSAQIGDRVLESNFDTTAPSILRNVIFAATPGANVLDALVSSWEGPEADLMLYSGPGLPQQLQQMQFSAPFSFVASFYLLEFRQVIASCDQPRGAAYASCQALDANAVATLQIAGNSAIVNAELLPSTSEVPLPASAWLFGSALLGLGARRWRQAA